MKNTNENIDREALYGLPGKLSRNGISGKTAEIDERFIESLIRFFLAEPAAVAVTYPVSLRLEGLDCDGTVEIYRSGFTAVRRNH